MAQVSQFWGGATIGDSGPYSFDQYNRPFRVLVSNGSADAGIAVRYLNQLAGTTTGLRANGVDILSGAALVRGIWYTSTATINHALPAVGSGGGRSRKARGRGGRRIFAPLEWGGEWLTEGPCASMTRLPRRALWPRRTPHRTPR